MRAAWLVALVVLLAGFDHIVHDRDLDVKGKPAVPCAQCHVEQKGKLVGKPGHAACFGACHGPPPKPPSAPAMVLPAVPRLMFFIPDPAALPPMIPAMSWIIGWVRR